MSNDKIDITQEELDSTYNITDKKESKDDKSEQTEIDITIEEEDEITEKEFFDA